MSFSPLSRFIAACGLTNLADGIALVAWAWIASLLTRDPLLIAAVPAMLKAPWFLLVLPAGVLTDRKDRRRLILGADGFRALAYLAAGGMLALALPFAAPPEFGTDRPGTLAALLALAFAIGTAEVLRDNTAQTMIPALVPPEGLERANGRQWAVEMTANAMIGPALAGLLLALSPAAPFVVNAAAMALAVVIVWRLRGDFRPQTEADAATATPRRHWAQELGEGWRFLIANPALRGLAVLTGLFNFAFEMTIIGLVLWLQERLGIGAWGMSVILGAGAVGGVVAGFGAARLVAGMGPSRTLRLAMLFAAVFPLAALSADLLWLVALAMLWSEFWGILWNTVSVSYRQRIIPRRMLGRVNATYRMFALGMVPLGMLASGLSVRVAQGLGLARETALLAPFAVAAAVFVIVTAVYWRFLGRVFTR